MPEVQILEDSEVVGFIDLDSGEYGYSGDDSLTERLLQSLQKQKRQSQPVQADESSPHDGMKTVPMENDQYRELVEGALEDNGIATRYVDERSE